MSRMEKRKTIEAKKRDKLTAWMLIMVFIASTVLFYFFGPYFFGALPWQREPEEPYRVVFDDEKHDVSFVVEEEIVFLPLSWVEDQVTGELEIRQNPLRARMIVEEEQLNYEDRNLTEFMRNDDIPLEVSLLEAGDEIYFPLSGLDMLLDHKTTYHPETELVTIDQLRKPYQSASVREDTALREDVGLFSRRMTDLEAGESVRVLETWENHIYIRTDGGFFGFLPKDSVQLLRRHEPETEHLFIQHVPPSTLEHPFGMVWEYVGNAHPDRSEDEIIPALSVVSPTWFELENEMGDLVGKAQFRYATYMRDRGYQIWGLVTNAFDPDMTESFLMNTEAQDHFIRQLLLYASLYRMEGINLDFENIYYQNQQELTDFVHRLSEKLRDQGLIFSIDVTIPGGSLNWSQVYDRSSLAPLVDYVCVMTYDEHWANSPVAGSVASIGWVETGIQNTLKEVPPEKVLLGLPFYTRLWEETTQPDGSITVSSRALGMDYAESILEENNIGRENWQWLEEAGQHYAEFEAEGMRYRIWLEDERSIALKASLVKDYGLAGFAGWRKGFEKTTIWDVLKDTL